VTAITSPRSTLPALIAETPLVPQTAALVLFGRDAGGKPRAAWFGAGDAEAAITAAAIMRLRALPLTDDAGRALAAQLARGRVLPSGRAFVPSAKRDLYASVVALAGDEAGLRLTEEVEAAGAGTDTPLNATQASAAEAPPAPRPGDRTFVGCQLPSEREQIGLGSVVLAHEGPDEGWWEAEVIGINGRVLSLRWRDYPTQPTILRNAGELALLPPGKA
jgi:hypothetical protein